MRGRIIETAGVLFAENGFFGTSMQDIADNLAITKAALYYHFSSKNEIYLALVDKTFRMLEDSIFKAVAKGNTPAEKLCLAIEAYFHFAKDRPQVKFLSLPPAEKLGAEFAQAVISFNKQLFDIFSSLIMDVMGRKRSKGEEKQALLTIIWNALLSFPQQILFSKHSYKKTALSLTRLIESFSKR